MQVIYAIICKINNKQYIGSTTNHNRRKYDHFKDLEKGVHCNVKLQRAYNKYGINAFEFVVLEEILDSKKLLEKEQYYFDTVNPEYNICKIAGSSRGRETTETTRKKLSSLWVGPKNPCYGKFGKIASCLRYM